MERSPMFEAIIDKYHSLMNDDDEDEDTDDDSDDHDKETDDE